MHRIAGLYLAAYRLLIAASVTFILSLKPFEYPFKLRKKFEADMQAVMADIANRSQQCAVGYSPQNLAYAKQNVKELPSAE